ncbi:MAG: hypothetical protein DWQ31_09135 [Planctomycetota bacterium]|nr:MAG: hypothetical protein DWQ31_09135 [Planctomycetota bacterium]REJ91384.1 MAG: hypothetical protein DWQ35_14630 [Planctomycetota bacterium]REK18496.1 MAG: hypothetical protein DWQ42_20055 [Planctomycetota bacterium]REK39444.1 MAG: hypothetical protein DWQ46_19450 [Planctomycetota bacterium]
MTKAAGSLAAEAGGVTASKSDESIARRAGEQEKLAEGEQTAQLRETGKTGVASIHVPRRRRLADPKCLAQ